MTFELPEPAIPHSRLVTSKGVFGDLYTADQMQATYAAGRASALEDAAPEDEPVEITELMQLVYDYADAFHDRLERIDAGDHHNILPMKAIQTGIRDQIRDQLALLYAPKGNI